MGIEQNTKQDSGEANFVDLVEGKYDNADSGQESIQGQIEQEEARLQINIAHLQENTASLPDNVEIRNEEINRKVEEFKNNLRENRDKVATILGLGSIPIGIALPYLTNLVPNPGENALLAVAVSAFVVATDQIMSKVNRYRKSREYEGRLREQVA